MCTFLKIIGKKIGEKAKKIATKIIPGLDKNLIATGLVEFRSLN